MTVLPCVHEARPGYWSATPDVSAAVDLGNGTFVAAEDLDDTLRVYSETSSGAPQASLNIAGEPPSSSTPADISAGLRLGNTVHWIGSRSGTGAGGDYTGLRCDLLG